MPSPIPHTNSTHQQRMMTRPGSLKDYTLTHDQTLNLNDPTGRIFFVREHLISSQFFSKRNAFQMGFTPSLPPLSERLVAHFPTRIDVVLPQDLVYPRRNCSQRVSCPSPQEKLQPTSSPLLPRFLHSPSLSTHRLLCAWPPPEADRDCRQRKHLQTSHIKRLDGERYGRSFLTTGFPKKFRCRDIVDPTTQRKTSLMRSACAWCVCARDMCCSKSTVKLLRQCSTSATSWWGPALPMPRGALRRLDRLAYGRSPRLVDLPNYRGLSSDRAGPSRSIRTSKVSSKLIFFPF